MSKIFFAALLVTVALACQIVPYHPKTHGKSHREFTLEFQYACRKGTDFDSCQGSISWNGKVILAVAPEDHDVHTKVMQVFVDIGDNSLQFRGTGQSDKRGLTIDNVKLVRYGTKVNIVVNGDFERPNLQSISKKWKIFKRNIPGWATQEIEIGLGHIYNNRWNSGQVCELDANKNNKITQTWSFDKDYFLVSSTESQETPVTKEEDISVEEEQIDESEPEIAVVSEPAIDENQPEIAVTSDEPAIDNSEPEIDNSEPDFGVVTDKPAVVEDQMVRPAVMPIAPTVRTYTLEFEYACRKQLGFGSCQGFVFWNGKKISHVSPADYKIHKNVVNVEATEGENSLKFEGAGKKDGLGLTIDNVKLFQEKSKKDIVINGGFEQPNLKSMNKKWNIFNSIPGWEGKDIEVGLGQIYNPLWKSQVVELDGKKNINGYFVQKWTFDGDFQVVDETEEPEPEVIDQPTILPAPQGEPAILVAESSSQKYRIEFEYACRKEKSFDICEGNVFWNEKKIFHVIPSDYKVHKKTIEVVAVVGTNSLGFEGEGKDDSFGLTIDNVKVIKVSTSEDVAVNGDFEKPDVKKKWKVSDSIPGWKGISIEVGWGKIYNKQWKSQVVELDGHKQAKLVQKWTCDGNYNMKPFEKQSEFVPDYIVDKGEPALGIPRPAPQALPAVSSPSPAPAIQPSVLSQPTLGAPTLGEPTLGAPTLNEPTLGAPTLTVENPSTKSYKLTFDYACRKKVEFDSCEGKVFWNGKEAVHVLPSDYEIHNQNVEIEVKPGQNELRFEGAGKMDTYGLTIDNVKLVEDGTDSNIVINGGFEKPDLGKGWKVYDQIEGWKGKGIEVGYGQIYNSRWTSQIVELDGHDHGYLAQKWNFDQSLNLKN